MSLGAPEAQWVKRWPTDLAVKGSSPVRGEDLINRKRGFIAHSLSLSAAYRPGMTEILLKRTKNRKSSIHPSMPQTHACAQCECSPVRNFPTACVLDNKGLNVLY